MKVWSKKEGGNRMEERKKNWIEKLFTKTYDCSLYKFKGVLKHSMQSGALFQEPSTQLCVRLFCNSAWYCQAPNEYLFIHIYWTVNSYFTDLTHSLTGTYVQQLAFFTLSSFFLPIKLFTHLRTTKLNFLKIWAKTKGFQFCHISLYSSIQSLRFPVLKLTNLIL